MERAELLATLHLRAVLPALTDLIAERDPGACAIVESDFALELRVRDDLRATVRARAGAVEVTETPGPGAARLQFRNAAALNALFQERPGVPPLPTSGFWRIGAIIRFARMAKRMSAVLQPAAASDVPRERHARLAFGVAMRALPLVTAHDEIARRILRSTPSGLVLLSVPPAGFEAWVRVTAEGVVTGPGAPTDPPSARISVRDLGSALASLAGEADSQAEVGLGRVVVEGLLPLADGFDALLQRVDAYLGRAARTRS